MILIKGMALNALFMPTKEDKDNTLLAVHFILGDISTVMWCSGSEVFKRRLGFNFIV